MRPTSRSQLSRAHRAGWSTSSHTASPTSCAIYRTSLFIEFPKPANAYSLGAPLLASAGLLRAAMVAGRRRACHGQWGQLPVPGGQLGPLCSWSLRAHHRPDGPSIGQGRGAASRESPHGAPCAARGESRHRELASNSADVIEHVGVPEDRVRTVYYGVDASAFRPASDDERVRRARHWGGQENTRGSHSSARSEIVARVSMSSTTRGARSRATPSWDADLVVVGAGAELPLARASGPGRSGRAGHLSRLPERRSADPRRMRRARGADAVRGLWRRRARGAVLRAAFARDFDGRRCRALPR